MQTLTLKTLRKTITRDEYKERIYLKNKSSGTRFVLECALVNFDKFCKEEYGKKADELILTLSENQGDSLYHFLQDFIDFMTKKGLSVASQKAYFSFIRSFLRSQGIKVYSEDIRDLIRFPTKIKEIMEPLSKDQIRTFLDSSKQDRKALYLSLLSSGMRIGEALSLRKKDIDFTSSPIKIRIQGLYTKTKQTRETYISSEAEIQVKRLVKEKNDDDLVFGKSNDLRLAINIEEHVFSDLRQRCSLTEKYQDGKRYKVNLHSMRAFFHTQASIIHDEQYANAMDGHQGYLMQYYRLSPEKRVEMYRKLEPYLQVYSDEKLTKTQEELREKVDSQTRDIEKLTKMVARLQQYAHKK